jgi:uncharacterized protein (TIGR02145 family)
MKNNLLCIFLLTTIVCSCTSEEIKYKEGPPLIDIDGNKYETIEIGGKIWMSENLAVSKYRNGEEILKENIRSDGELKELSKNSTYWKYDFEQDRNYGNLYKYNTVSNVNGLAPEGWHIATEDKWVQLIKFLGGKEKAPIQLRSSDGWGSENKGTNKSGFNALPSGVIDGEGKNKGTGESGHWWTNSKHIYITHNKIVIQRFSSKNQRGVKERYLSIRCVKDKE